MQDYSWVQQSLANSLANQPVSFDQSMTNRLAYLANAILASCPEWDFDESHDLCKIAAEISELLAINIQLDESDRAQMRLKAALLYEHAGLPALSKSVIHNDDFRDSLSDFFKRTGHFGLLNKNGSSVKQESSSREQLSICYKAFRQDAQGLANYEQGYSTDRKNLTSFVKELSNLFALDVSTTNLHAFGSVVAKRLTLATRTNVSPEMFSLLKKIEFPTELWLAQQKALDAGLLDPKFDSWGLAAPTGTGKTFLTRLLIVNILQNQPSKKVIYIVPSRALVYEVSTSLQKAFENISIEVLAVNPQLIDLDGEEEQRLENASVVILTPEKADLLLRIGQSNLEQVSTIIIDEAHHIEAETRGILLELYIWRLKKLFPTEVRFVFLSAVVPNLYELTSWTGKNPRSETIGNRATRMRAGIYRIKENDQGWIDYSDGTRIRVVENKVEKALRRGLIQLVDNVQNSGPVLVVAKGKKECENLANGMQKWLLENSRLKTLTSIEENSAEFNRLDSRLEREMYPGVAMRSLLRNRIAYHHAGLPPRVRIAVEDAIRAGLVDFVFATTTLAEGVNFPFSTVVVQSLALKEPPQTGIPVTYRPITPRTFWNIAGRAGRPGFDKEGQVILFEPSLGLEKINAVLKNYLNPNLKEINPLTSALSESLIEIAKAIDSKKFSHNDLEQIELGENIPRKIKGTVNLLRVGLVHAKATKILTTPQEILDGSFANKFLNEGQKQFAEKVVTQQSAILDQFFESEGAPSETLVAELGLSLDTISRLRDYVMSLENWQIEGFKRLFYGGNVNIDQARYVIGPVSKRIAELEGEKLGGYLSELIINWISGVPLSVVKSKTTNFNRRIEDLISVIYSRVQFLLPWGLFATHTIVEEEARKRSIEYTDEIRKLAYISDAGVPNFDAFRLVNLDFERADASRLSIFYHNKGGLKLGVDIIGWLINEKRETIERCLRGFDNRRVDYDLEGLIREIRESYTAPQ